jgi:hypothetical protein
LASGRVLDERLLPIEGARVWATAIDRGRKIDTYGGSTRTRADGTVELFGTTPESQVRVWARHPSYSTGQPAEVAPGSTGFVITLAQAGRIAGSVILPAEWMADFCTVYARPEEWEHEDDDWTDEVEVVRPGYFALDSLDPGTWDLLLAFGAPSQGVDVRGVEVVGGETTRDPRLQELDLRDRVRLFVIEAEDANGKPVEAEVHFRPSEGGEWASESADEGRADLIAFFESLDLFVVGSDNTSAYVTDVREDRRIELAAGHSVRVVWAAEPPVDGTPYGVRVRLELAEDGLPEVAVDVDMGSSNVLPRAGRYRVTYWLVETGKPFFSPLGRASEELIVDTQAQIALSLPQELLDALAERKKE